MSCQADHEDIYKEKLLTSDYEPRCLVERTTPMYYNEIIVDERLRAEMSRRVDNVWTAERSMAAKLLAAEGRWAAPQPPHNVLRCNVFRRVITSRDVSSSGQTQKLTMNSCRQVITSREVFVEQTMQKLTMNRCRRAITSRDVSLSGQRKNLR